MANFFTDRVVQYPGRVMMTPTGGSDTYDMSRAEGAVTTPGSPFNSETFNGAIDLYAQSFGTCSTAGSTSTKVVTCSGFALVTGATISVKFTNANTYNGTVYLNVNGTGAKQVRYVSGASESMNGAWRAGEVVNFVYDGTYWLVANSSGLILPVIEPENMTPAVDITASTGTLVSKSAIKYGGLLFLTILVSRDVAVRHGYNIFSGTLNTTDLRPASGTASGIIASGNSFATGIISYTGGIRVATLGTNDFPANTNAEITFTYPLPF